MGHQKPKSCPEVGELPDEYARRLPKNVPAVEQPPTGPAGTTWYFPIALSKTSPTGVFVPSGFTYPNEVDIILYFHGNKDGAFQNINQYWHGDYNSITLREYLNASGKQALLVAPTMGYYPGHMLWGNPDLGVFGSSGGGDCFLHHVMAWLGKYDDGYASREVVPTVRKIVLAGHSGGGNGIHAQMESMKERICEIWCFDVVYGNVSDWIDFASRNPTKPMTFYHAVQSSDSFKDLSALKDATETKKQINLDHVKLIEAGNHHFPALTNNFRDRVNATTCFASR